MGIAAQSLHGIKTCLIPHPDNDHRPLALRHTPLALTSMLLIAAKVAAAVIVAITPTHADLSTITVNRIIQLTNDERARAGLSPLEPNPKLMQAAQEKGQHMLQEEYFAHISPSGVTPWFWISKAGYSYQIAGENLAIDFTQAEAVVNAWIASPTHKDNMLHPAYTETGVAVVTGQFQGGTSTIVVHMFGKPTAAKVASEATSPPPQEQAPPAPEPQPIIAPQTPRISFASEENVFRTEITLIITGDPNSTAHVLLNNSMHVNAPIPESGTVMATVDISDVPDGDITIQAYASNSGGNSQISDALMAVKHTQGPDIPFEHIITVISPQFDSGYAALFAPAGEYAAMEIIQGDAAASVEPHTWVLVSAFGAIQIQFMDEFENVHALPLLSVAPQFDRDSTQGQYHAPQKIAQVSRRMTAAILVTVLILLTLSIVIRIRIQHPALITHASLVALLAAALFFW